MWAYVYKQGCQHINICTLFAWFLFDGKIAQLKLGTKVEKYIVSTSRMNRHYKPSPRISSYLKEMKLCKNQGFDNKKFDPCQTCVAHLNLAKDRNWFLKHRLEDILDMQHFS